MAFITFQPSDHFNTILYTGDGTTNRALTGVGFAPDFVWIKSRETAFHHQVHDRVRGTSGGVIFTNLTNAQDNTYSLASFDSDGITVCKDTNNLGQNTNGDDNVVWNWKAGGTGSSNSDGTISSTVSANTTAGISIVTWTGNSGSVGHGLGEKPAMIITKSLGATGGWYVTQQSLSTEMQDNYMFLNDTSANTTNDNIWGGEPTTSTFSVGSGLIGNTTHVAYVFATKKGFSKFGSYYGDASADGPFIYTGFKPAFVIIKRAGNSGNNWNMIDTKRNPSNDVDKILFPSSNDTEVTTTVADILSTGFKIRLTSSGWNHNQDKFIYMAFAEEPLVSSNNIPATAR